MNTNTVLDVVAVVSNPCRYKSRTRLFADFAKRVEAAGARLTIVEAAFGDRDHDITLPGNPRHVQVRTSHELWHKENLINIGISRLSPDWKYVAWIDADVSFQRPDWVAETIEQLQHFHVVQMFSHAVDLGPQHEVIENHVGFGYSFVQRKPVNHGSETNGNKAYAMWHPGFAWAARRSFIERTGGLMDWTLLGAADHMMACAMIGHPVPIDGRVKADCPNFLRLAEEWGKHAATLNQDLGYVPGTLLHHFHGAKQNRKYQERWEVIWSNRYDPLADIKKDWQGLWQLSGNKPKLRDDLRQYFRQRNEDSIDV
jgi:hypothetical protein